VKDRRVTSHQSQVWAGLAGAFVFFAFCAHAYAQAAECKATETQAECHARLKCKPYEELEDCKKRLKQGSGQPSNNSGGDRGGGDRGGDGRGDQDRGGEDRGDRGRSRDRGNDGGGRRRGGRSEGRRRGGSGGRGFQANKVFGLGLELGEPTGLNGKYFFSESSALDFGIGWIYRHYYYGDGVNIYADYLFHPASLASNPSFELPFYFGVGLRFWDFDYCDRNVCGYGGSAIGIRIPFGLSIDFNNSPIDIFFQLGPVLNFARGDYYDRYRDRNYFGIDGSIGIRLWLK
jgi:hypothetical protein